MEAAAPIPTRPRRGRSRASVADTRERIITATLDALARHGCAGTTARVIASSAGVPVGLIFYHFGTLDLLLLAVLDHTSAARLPRWHAALAELRDPTDLMRVMGDLYAEDLASGHAVAVRELVSNGDLSARLGNQMAVRMEPWFDLAEGVAARTLRGSPVLALISARDLAVTAVALYLGLDVVSRLAGTTTSATALVAAGERIAPLLGSLRSATRPASRRPRRIALD
ncbi:MAG: TetR family transcriptional regulator [Candidatus Dormibacteria bacterium]